MIQRYGSGTGKVIETVIVDKNIVVDKNIIVDQIIVDKNRCFNFCFYYFEANA